jgi:hypothetical protein
MSDTTIVLGAYQVRIGLRPDNPAFPVYLVFRGATLIGRQFSRPSESDCQYLEHWTGQYACDSTWLETSCVERRQRAGQHTAESTRRRGRPRKAVTERDFEEALEV